MERYDVVVVGAGPAGSTAARFAAVGGARTLLVDRRPTLGVPVQCGEFLPSADELEDLLGCPDAIGAAYTIPPSSVERRITSMACRSPYGRRYSFPLDGWCVDRAVFDQTLAEAAVRAGAELRHPLGVIGVHDDVVELAHGDAVRAEVVIGADGPLSTVGRSAGLVPPRELYRMITATSVGTFSDEILLAFGHVAPGGYAWVFPKDRAANVGLGVTRLPRGATLSSLLDGFVAEEHLAEPTDRTRWWVPIGPPPTSLVRGRALLCGDAANLVMATNGAGIPTAVLSGYDAGVAAADHVRTGAPLAAYDLSWKAHLFEPLARGARVKAFGDRFVANDLLLALGMRYIGARGLDEMMRLRWPARLGWVA